MRDPTCADSIRLLSEQIIDGNLSDDVRDLVMVCWLIALDDTKKIRPIAGGCIEFVLSMHYLMGNNKDAVRQVIQKSGLQFGIGCREGVISSARITQLALEADPNKLVLKVDYAAAFQNTKRKQMLNMIFEQPRFAPLFRIIHFAYAKQSMLLVRDKMGIVQASISSEEGCRQGCVAGSLLFANTTLPALEAVQKEFPSLVMTAVLDDTTLIADGKRHLRSIQTTEETSTSQWMHRPKEEVRDAAHRQRPHPRCLRRWNTLPLQVLQTQLCTPPSRHCRRPKPICTGIFCSE